MPVDVLRCRVCESDYPALANGICVRCFGPLEPVYDWDEIAARRHARADRGGAALALALRRPAARPTPPEDALERARLHAARPGAAARERRSASARCYLKLDLANPTHSFKDRVVAVAAAKAREFGLDDAVVHLDRQPRERRRRAGRGGAGCRAVIFCPAGLEPEKMLATTVYGARVYGVRGSYDDCSRLISELAGEVDWGIRQRQPALVLRGGLEDARVRDRRAARLGGARRGRRADRLRRDVHEALAGLRAVRAARARSTASGRGSTAARRRAARPSRPRSPRSAASRRCGRTRSRSRSRSATRPTATSRSRPRAPPAARSTPSPRTRSARTWRCSPRRRASSARPRPASRSARCARPSRAASSASHDRVVAARHRHRPEDAAGGRAGGAGHARRDRAPTSTRCSRSSG